MKRFLVRLLTILFRRWVKSPESFLVPAYTGLGNFIMMTPMIQELQRKYPQAAIYILAGNPFGTESVFCSGDGIAAQVFWLDGRASLIRKILFFLGLRKYRIKTAFVPFDASPGFYRWGILLAGIPERIGHTMDVMGIKMGWTREALTRAIPLRLDAHESDLHYDLLEPLFAVPVRNYETFISSSGVDTLEKFGLSSSQYIVIQLAAANAQRTPKVWSLENFSALIRLFQQNNIPVVLPGDVNEAPLIAEFSKQFAKGVFNIAGKTSISEVSCVVKHARLLICHDSGLMHIGNAHRTPLIALYGPTDWVYTAPRAATSHIVKSSLPCQPCMKNFSKTEPEALRDCPINIQCMKDITVDEVYLKAKDLLSIE